MVNKKGALGPLLFSNSQLLKAGFLSLNLAPDEFHYIHKHEEAKEDAGKGYDHLPPHRSSNLLGQEAMLCHQDVDP